MLGACHAYTYACTFTYTSYTSAVTAACHESVRTSAAMHTVPDLYRSITDLRACRSFGFSRLTPAGLNAVAELAAALSSAQTPSGGLGLLAAFCGGAFNRQRPYAISQSYRSHHPRPLPPVTVAGLAQAAPLFERFLLSANRSPEKPRTVLQSLYVTQCRIRSVYRPHGSASSICTLLILCFVHSLAEIYFKLSTNIDAAATVCFE